MSKQQKHSFHLVDQSPWPMLSGFSALLLTFGFVLYMHGYVSGNFLFKWGFFSILVLMYTWWRDIIREGTYENQHSSKVLNGLKFGMLLFIASEVMFFFAFFWSFFHVSFNPGLAIGGVWPPVYLTILSPWKIPLLNSILLLTSGATVTLAHHAIIKGSKKLVIESLTVTIILAVIFTLLQRMEYLNAPFSINTSVYGSTFYMLTGFHGFHVLVGTICLTVCLIRVYFYQITTDHHFGFEAAAWYWHFVDVVWLFLFLTIYWWGS